LTDSINKGNKTVTVANLDIPVIDTGNLNAKSVDYSYL